MGIPFSERLQALFCYEVKIRCIFFDCDLGGLSHGCISERTDKKAPCERHELWRYCKTGQRDPEHRHIILSEERSTGTVRNSNRCETLRRYLPCLRKTTCADRGNEAESVLLQRMPHFVVESAPRNDKAESSLFVHLRSLRQSIYSIRKLLAEILLSQLLYFRPLRRWHR